LALWLGSGADFFTKKGQEKTKRQKFGGLLLRLDKKKRRGFHTEREAEGSTSTSRNETISFFTQKRRAKNIEDLISRKGGKRGSATRSLSTFFIEKGKKDRSGSWTNITGKGK